jgi:hypothetical protein
MKPFTHFLILLVLVFLLGFVLGSVIFPGVLADTRLPYSSLPSELLVKQPQPIIMNLQDTSPMSAYRIDANLAELGAWKPMNVPNLGHYQSDLNLVSPEGIPLYLFNFSMPTVEPLVNIGTPNRNATKLNATSGSELVYL